MPVNDKEFYTEPPYSYRPSIAQYLTNMEITRDGFIADILHLDRKKNLQIEAYQQDKLRIRLLSDNDLNDTEVFLWNYLKKREKNGVVELSLSSISKKTIEYYSFLVRKKAVEKFHSGFKISIPATHGSENPLLSIRIFTIIIGFIGSVFNFFLWWLFIVLGVQKILEAPSEIKVFFKSFLWRYIKVIFKVYLVLLVPALLWLFFLLAGFPFFSFISLLLLFPFFVIWIYAYYVYGKIFIDYVNWVFEKREASENRLNWLKFKAFIFKYSALEKKPLKYYELWDEFYYYALAVGAIKNPRAA